MSAPTFVIILIGYFTSIALADDFKTTNGKEYKNVAVSRVEPDGIVLTTNFGISKVYFTELPKDVQERFHYDPEKAAAAYAAQLAAVRQANERTQQGDELIKQRRQEQQKQQRQGAEQQAKQRNLQALVDSYAALQQEEDDLLLRIGQARRPGSRGRNGNRRYYVPNALADQLPYLEGHLSDVRKDKGRVRRQLEQAQRQP